MNNTPAPQPIALPATTFTPRTDRHLTEQVKLTSSFAAHPDFARGMERELAAKDALITKLQDALIIATAASLDDDKKWVDHNGDYVESLNATPESAAAELAELRALMDRMAAEMREADHEFASLKDYDDRQQQ